MTNNIITANFLQVHSLLNYHDEINIRNFQLWNIFCWFCINEKVQDDAILSSKLYLKAIMTRKILWQFSRIIFF